MASNSHINSSKNNKESSANDVPSQINIDAEARVLIDKWISKKKKIAELSGLKLTQILGFARNIKTRKKGNVLRIALTNLLTKENIFLTTLLSFKKIPRTNKDNSKSLLWFSNIFSGTLISILLIVLMICGFALGIYIILR